MKLHSFSVSRYRSISSAKKIRLDQTTVLIGPNNEGKSNILRGLVLAMTVLTRGRYNYQLGRRSRVGYRVTGYDWEKDYPVNLQKKKPKGETELVLEFALSSNEYDEFQKEVGSKITGRLPLRFCIGKQDVTVTYNKKGRGSATLSKKSDKIADFVSRRIEFEHIPAVRTARSAQEIVSELVSRELADLEEDKKFQDAIKKIQELQKPLLKSLANSIQKTLKQFLPDVKMVEINLPDEQRVRAFRRGVVISVDDGSMTPLNYKGDGVQSLAALAMIRHVSERRGKGKHFIVAIEEPESHLHPSAIHELKAVIEQLSLKHQVIITSHNPLFVDRRIVASNIVVNNRKARPAKNVEEIRKILGVRASDNLRNAEMVLVVEGEEDILSLRAILESVSSYLKTCFENGSLTFDSLVGGTNLSYKLSLLRDAICLYHVFLDDDKCGRMAYKKAKASGLLEDAQINFAKASGKSESEFEDLLDPALYKSVIEAKYNVSLGIPKFRGKKKWSDRVREVFDAHGKPWDDSIKSEVKRIVSSQVMTSPDKAIRTSEKTVIDSLVNTLTKRLKDKEKAQQDASADS